MIAFRRVDGCSKESYSCRPQFSRYERWSAIWRSTASSRIACGRRMNAHVPSPKMRQRTQARKTWRADTCLHTMCRVGILLAARGLSSCLLARALLLTPKLEVRRSIAHTCRTCTCRDSVLLVSVSCKMVPKSAYMVIPDCAGYLTLNPVDTYMYLKIGTHAHAHAP